MNVLNYTARNIFVYQEENVCFFLNWETFSFHISMIACFLRRHLGSSEDKIWPFLPCNPVDQAAQFTCLCPPGAQKTTWKWKMSHYTERCFLHVWKTDIVFLRGSLFQDLTIWSHLPSLNKQENTFTSPVVRSAASKVTNIFKTKCAFPVAQYHVEAVLLFTLVGLVLMDNIRK